ncbi:MAG: lmo0937 family membrane protein [Bacteroidota bacterium]|nr:lmo0937 family membrane protein [Bacteroidota bacterium]
MKNLTHSIIACITASIILSSCGQKLSLTKRHYRNGYHVSHTKKMNSVDQKTNDHSIVKHSEAVLKEKVSNPTQTVLLGADLSKNNSQTENINTPFVKTKSYVSPPVVTKNTNPNFASIARELMQPKKFLDNRLELNKKNTGVKHDGGSGGGHSLLWLLIVILLILWLLGFAGGYVFGGLIHIIVVVAVILFVLWLLRIV